MEAKKFINWNTNTLNVKLSSYSVCVRCISEKEEKQEYICFLWGGYYEGIVNLFWSQIRA